jgi:hypothetical protein
MKGEVSLTRPPKNTPKIRESDDKYVGYDQLVHAHYFLGSADWYVLEYSPEEDIIFCWAEISAGCGELGYTSIAELEEIEVSQKIILGSSVNTHQIYVEFENNWKSKSLRECLDQR